MNIKIDVNICDNEWYAINVMNGDVVGEGVAIIKGDDLKVRAKKHNWRFNTLRPAEPEEIPKQSCSFCLQSPTTECQTCKRPICNDHFDYGIIDTETNIKKCYCVNCKKPEPTLLERIEADYEGKKVVMLEWPKTGYQLLSIRVRNILSDTVRVCTSTSDPKPHIYAQSMKGFDMYVYDEPSGLKKTRKPTKTHLGKTIFPCAVLFEK